jgi:hypothetical protein
MTAPSTANDEAGSRSSSSGVRHRRGLSSGPTPEPLWISTAQASIQLGISRKTLFRLKQQGILKQERHWARKNPGRRCSDLLWHIQRCQLTLGRI